MIKIIITARETMIFVVRFALPYPSQVNTIMAKPIIVVMINCQKTNFLLVFLSSIVTFLR